MNTFHLSGYPRIGAKRELKFAVQAFWKGNTSEAELQHGLALQQALEASLRRDGLAAWLRGG